MATVLDALLIGIIATLNARVALTTLVGGRVFDSIAPSGTAYPLIVVGEPTEGADNALGRRGNRTTFTIHIWHRDENTASAEVSSRVVHAVYKEVEAALNLQPIAVGGSLFLFGTLAYVTGLVDQDNVSYHGIARFEALTRT